MINVCKERHKLIRKTTSNTPRKSPSDITGFQQCITDKLNNAETEGIANDLNKTITTTLLENQNTCCQATRKETRRVTKSEELTTAKELNVINKKISKAIRRDIRKFNQNQSEQTKETRRV